LRWSTVSRCRVTAFAASDPLANRALAPDVGSVVVTRGAGGANAAEVVTVVGEHDHRRGDLPILGVEFAEQLAEAVVDHRQLGS